MILAAIEGLPWAWVLTLGALTFGGVATGAVRSSEWHARNRVEDRLYFRELTVGRDLSERDGSIILDKFQVGIWMESIADFPLFFIIDEIRSTFEGRIYKNPIYKTRTGKVIKGRPSLYRDAPIEDLDLKVHPGAVFNGNIYFKIRYDKDDRGRFTLEHRIDFQVIPDRQNPGTFGLTWGYSDEGGTSR